jgi:hypothetical protein
MPPPHRDMPRCGSHLPAKNTRPIHGVDPRRAGGHRAIVRCGSPHGAAWTALHLHVDRRMVRCGSHHGSLWIAPWIRANSMSVACRSNAESKRTA